MKILYERITNPRDVANQYQLAVEDLCLPPLVLEQLGKDLDSSNETLPKPAKQFLPAKAMANWKVALLDRFDPQNVAASV
jgi:hypothetical protein